MNQERRIYRFRNIESLLDKYNELEKQEIFFAHRDDLNDPMEGYRELIWQGDKIVWHNFIKHYITCLNLSIIYYRINPDVKIELSQIPIEGKPNNTRELEKIENEIYEGVLDKCKLESLIESLALKDHKVRREELLFYLTHIHYIALKEIEQLHERYGMTDNSNPSYSQAKSNIELGNIPILVEEFYRQHPDFKPKLMEDVYSFMNISHHGQQLVSNYIYQTQESGMSNAAKRNRDLLLLEYPRIYISQLSRILYPTWYVACFLEDFSNSSIWSHYADNHKGVCLIFNAEIKENELFLRLNTITGVDSRYDGTVVGDVSKYIKGYSDIAFHKINYEDEVSEFDFFRSIGNLPISTLLSTWYEDEMGNRSKCAEHITNSENEEDWRGDYWKKFYRDISVKSKDWSYEREQRLITRNSLSIDLTDRTLRKMEYRFQDLVGIIFGINTSMKDKLKIIEIIAQKCENENREGFEFYQAYFDHNQRRIDAIKLSITS